MKVGESSGRYNYKVYKTLVLGQEKSSKANIKFASNQRIMTLMSGCKQQQQKKRKLFRKL